MKDEIKQWLTWENASASPEGVPGGNRPDRIVSSLLNVDTIMILSLPHQYIYSIFYYNEDGSLKEVSKISKFGFDRILYPGDRIRIYGASDENISIEEFEKSICLYPYNPEPVEKVAPFFVQKTIKLIGDSITSGSGGSGYGNTGKCFIQEKGFERFENLYGICWANYLKYFCEKEQQCDVKNFGCSKYTTTTITRFLDDLVEEADDVILLMIGTNDRMIANDAIADYSKRVDSIIAYCINKGKQIVLLSPPPSPLEDGIQVNYKLGDIDGVLKEKADYLGIPFISIYYGLVEFTGENGISLDTLFGDGLHPNDNGYYYIFRILCDKIGLSFHRKECSLDCEYDLKAGESLYIPEGSTIEINRELVKTSAVRNLFLEDSNVIIKNNTDCFAPYITEDPYPLNENNTDQRVYYSYMAGKEMQIDNSVKGLSDALLPHVLDDFHKYTENVLNGEILFPTSENVKIGEKIFDTEFTSQERTSQLWLKSLFWLIPVLYDYKNTKDHKCLEICEAHIKELFDWLNWDFEKVGFEKLPSADHSCAVRCVVFYNLLQIFPTDWKYRNDIIVLLYHHTLWMLKQSQRIKNNHAIIIIISLLHIVRLLKEGSFRSELLSHIQKEIYVIYNENFYADGLCKENTIGYHNFNLLCFRDVIRISENFGLPLDFDELKAKMTISENVLRQMIWQNGEIPPVGDSQIGQLHLESINESHFYKEAGWVIIKDAERYISYKCGFSSPAHKHVDDGSLSFRLNGTDIFVDSGMYNYDRKDEIRQYVESARGHSAIFPESVYQLLSPDYCPIVKEAAINRFDSDDKGYTIESVLKLNTGFYSWRNINIGEGSIEILDSFLCLDGSDVEMRFCLHPDCRLIECNKNNIAVLKIDNVFFSIKFVTDYNGLLLIEKGYYSPKANMAQQNMVCVYHMPRAEYGIVSTLIKYGSRLEDVMDYREQVKVGVRENEAVLSSDGKSEKTYFLLKNRDIIDEVTTDADTVRFPLRDDTEYTAYILKRGRSIRDSFCERKKFSNKKQTISIFGSCVSRDLLEYDNSKSFVLGQYVARQSIISAVSAPLKQQDPVISLDSDFQKRMVKMDLMKTTFEYLKSSPSDYLIIDLIDERFPLFCFDNSYFTASNEAVKGCGFFSSLNRFYKRVTNGSLFIENTNVDEYIDIFCKRINELYANDKIIIHRVLLVDSYKDKNGKIVSFDKNYKKNNRKVNAILNYMYDRLADRFNGAYVINEVSGTNADESHKWGLAPMHYEEAYYRRVLMRLEEIIKDWKLSY